MHSNADPQRPYYYLAGPMTGIPAFNFPEFDRISGRLRDAGYNIISPAELDSPEARKKALASPDGAGNKEADSDWRDYLRRDVNIVMDENCLGVICINGWENSKGARLETYVAEAFGKPIGLFLEWDHVQFTVHVFDRTAALNDLTWIGPVQYLRPDGLVEAERVV